MAKTFKDCFETLEGLSTKALDRSAVQLVLAEKQNVPLAFIQNVFTEP